MLKKLLKRIIHYTYRPFALRYIRKNRWFVRNGLNVFVPVGIFHPGLFFSSKMMADFILEMDLAGKSLLELGCGSGYVGLVAAQSDANVTLSDINPLAVQTAQDNAIRNNLIVQCVESDLFSKLHDFRFDIIVINPPYYQKRPNNMAERAWFAGEKLEYFQKLFSSKPTCIHEQTQIYICASGDVDISEIEKIASENKVQIDQVLNRRIWWEENYVYQLTFSF